MQLEVLRAEVMLDDADFAPALDMVERIIQALLTVIAWVVGLLFGTTVADNAVPRPEVDLAPDPQVEYRLDISGR